MGSINASLNLMAQAIDNDQAALNVVSNNVANASTTGYTKQTPTWQENTSVSINGASYGQGATMTGGASQRDTILNQRLNQQQQSYASSSTRLTALDSIQSLFSVSTSSSSTSGDIGTAITSFFDTFSTLEASPTSSTYRQEVLSAAQTLASDVSSTASSLESQRSSLNQQVSNVVSQVNALTASIAQLNSQIKENYADGSDAGTLEDQRQEYLSELSELVGINEVTESNNGLQVTTTDGQVLVAGTSSYELTTGSSSGVTEVYSGTTDITSSLASGGGSLGGYLTARDTDITDALASLDQLAYSISTEVNSVNNSGADLNGDTSNAGNIFSEPTAVSGSALAMSVVMTDTNLIAAASSTGATGDNTNAVAMYALASSTIVNGQTPSNYYSSFISELGSKITNVETENTSEEASITQLQTQVDSLSSVNLNDEASALTVLERSYQAASQMFSILDTLMASALNLGSETTVS